LPYRFAILGLLLGAEVLIASLAFDGQQIAYGSRGLLGLLRGWGGWAHRWALGAAVIFAGFAFLRRLTVPDSLLGGIPRLPWLLAHLGSLAAFGGLSTAIYHGQSGSNPAVAAWTAASLSVAVTAAFTVMPPAAWLELLRRSGSLWLFAAAGSGLGCLLGWSIRFLWEPVTATTFAVVKFLLSLVLKDTIVQPERLRVGTPNFTAIVTPDCSGLEGIGLFLIFGMLWLILFRDELRFPHALTLLPVGIAALYLLNAVRITALVLIGNAGWREIAVRGFHSQAGWIAFNCVAFALLLGARRLRWILAGGAPVKSVEYPAAPYVVPFMAVLAAGILAGAVTARFEWFYGLRLVAAAAALWTFRRRYRDVDWRFGWLGLLAGLFAFGVWIAVDWMMGSAQSANGMPPELISADSGVRIAWLASRIAGGVIAVPVVEELAFRGFGLRRLIDGNFETVSWSAITGTSLVASSILFGVLHGGLWVAGILVGLVYGAVMARRGRLGESIGAHATTNALLASYVLATGRWDLW
jgi:exosortase E/protease (VPEID-CTERM system)